MNTLYEQLLLFPDRAENLGQFATYDVDLEHWKGLSSAFRDTFRTVYERGASAVLLVHGSQGTGKTLFSRRLTQDFDRAAKGAVDPDRKNLWHTLVGEDPPTRATIERATSQSVLRRVEPKNGWLEDQRNFARANQQRVRIFVIDDAHKDAFIREWAGLSQAEYLGFKERNTEHVALSSVAERLVEDCRGDFQKTIFLLLSNDAHRMKILKDEIDKSHQGLAKVLELPLPDASTKEQIIRKNINRLNRMSYWYCLDSSGKEERLSAYDVLIAESTGFTECFHAIDNALRSDEKRSGRPANRSLITLVTLGMLPSNAKAFLDDKELTVQEHYRGNHIGMWWMRDRWASLLYEGSDLHLSRQARMVESEFAFRWVALDIKSTYFLCEPPAADDIGAQLLSLIQYTPSIAKPEEVKKHGEAALELENRVEQSYPPEDDLNSFVKQFTSTGQYRSTIYEPAIMKRYPGYSRGFPVFPAVKPDLIVSDYRACSVTSAGARDADKISEAIRRSCHAVEFTAYLQTDMSGLQDYLLEKVSRYGLLLESV